MPSRWPDGLSRSGQAKEMMFFLATTKSRLRRWVPVSRFTERWSSKSRSRSSSDLWEEKRAAGMRLSAPGASRAVTSRRRQAARRYSSNLARLSARSVGLDAVSRSAGAFGPPGQMGEFGGDVPVRRRGRGGGHAISSMPRQPSMTPKIRSKSAAERAGSVMVRWRAQQRRCRATSVSCGTQEPRLALP